MLMYTSANCYNNWIWVCPKPFFDMQLISLLFGGGEPQVGEVTRLSIQSLLLIWSRLHDWWGNPLHVTSPTWGPPPPCKQALTCTGGRDFSKIGEWEWFGQEGQRKRYKTIKSWTKIQMKIFFHHPPALPSRKRREGGKVKGKSWDCVAT